MKNSICILLSSVFLSFLLSCKEENKFLFNSKNSFVSLEIKSAKIGENNEEVKIPVVLAAYEGNPVSVHFDFADTINSSKNLAVLGKDFELLNASQTLTFETGVGVDTITIKSINNEINDGTREVWLVLTENSANYDIGLGNDDSKALLSILDDDLPSLNFFEGEYTQTGNSIWSNNPITWTCNIKANPEKETTQILIEYMYPYSGYRDAATGWYAVATVDQMAQSIEIELWQRLLDRGGNLNYLSLAIGKDFDDYADNYKGTIDADADKITGSYTIDEQTGQIEIRLNEWGMHWMYGNTGEPNVPWWNDYFTSSTLTKNQN